MSSRYNPYAVQSVGNVARNIGDYARNTPLGQALGLADEQQERYGQRYGSYDSNVKEGDLNYAGKVYSGGSQVGSGGDITQYQQQGQPSMLGGLPDTNIPTGVGRTREVLTPDDAGYINYTSRQEIFDAFKPQIEELTLTDEEWSQATEAERQANYEARTELARNAGSTDLINPYGSVSLASADEESLSNLYNDLDSKLESGELSQEAFDRYTDDLRRSTTPDLDDQRNMLLNAGFTEEELLSSGYGEFDSIEDDSFRSTVEDIQSFDERQAVQTYELYDTRQEQNFSNAFNQLDSLQESSLDGFKSAYGSMDTNQKNAYLYHQFKEGGLEEDEYQASVVRNLQADGVPLFITDEGEIAKGYKYQTGYQVLQFGDSTDKRDAGDNFSRVSLDTLFNEADADEGFIERRHAVEDMENGNISWGEVGYEKVPEASIFSRIKTPVLNYITGGLYSATQDPEQFLIDQFGASILNGALQTFDVNLPEMPPEVEAGIKKTVVKVAQGEDFKDALQSGVGEWASQAGIGGELEETLRKVGREFDDNYLQPIKDMIPDFDTPDTPEGIKAIEDTVRDIGSGIADAAEPFKEPLQDVGRFIDDYLLQPAKDALLTGGGALVAQPSSTRTTDGLFRDELFKFKEKDLGLVERVTQDEPREQLADFNDDPFASDFNNRNLFG
jgi:hypothetical protein